MACRKGGGIMRAATRAGWEAVAVEVGSAVTIPLLGTVAAGLPFQAFPVEGTLELPAGLWGGRTVFALRARLLDDRRGHPRRRLPDRRAARDGRDRSDGGGGGRRRRHRGAPLPGEGRTASSPARRTGHAS